MNGLRRSSTRLFMALALLILADAACAQVEIYAWQENQPSQVVYHYRIVNNGNDRVLGFEIGQNDLTSEMQLTVRPVGFVEDELAIPPEMEGLGFPIPPGSAGAPVGWEKAFVLGDEHTSGAALHFYVGDSGSPLGQGTLRDFTVAVPLASSPYRTSNWVAFLERGIRVPGTLAPDPEAPVPTASVSGGGSGCPGTSAQLNASLTGNGPWTVRWSDGVQITATGTTISRTVTPPQAQEYSISQLSDVNRNGTSSGIAYANISAPASVVTHPQSVTIAKHQTATLTVTAGGATPLTYQWYRGNSGQTTTPVGTNSATFTTPKLNGTTSYWVKVTNACGTANSDAATVTVR